MCACVKGKWEDKEDKGAREVAEESGNERRNM